MILYGLQLMVLRICFYKQAYLGIFGPCASLTLCPTIQSEEYRFIISGQWSFWKISSFIG